jgi:hypothetical protein
MQVASPSTESECIRERLRIAVANECATQERRPTRVPTVPVAPPRPCYPRDETIRGCLTSPALDFNLEHFLIDFIERLIVEIEGGLLLKPLLLQFSVGLHGLLKRQSLTILRGFRHQRPG